MRIEGYILKFDHIWSKDAVYYMPSRPILMIDNVPLGAYVNVETREDGLYGTCDLTNPISAHSVRTNAALGLSQWSAVATQCYATREGVVTMCTINKVQLVESGRGYDCTIGD